MEIDPRPHKPKLHSPGDGGVAKLCEFFLENRFIAALLALLIIAGGIYVSPFDWLPENIPHNSVAVDAIPDLGENQQIVYTEWPGRSPRDIEDQITYPLTVRLLSIKGVKAVRSQSMFGFSSIYVVFDDSVDFYFSRDRVQEKLNSLPSSELPEGVKPQLGPDATPLGQVFWYTLEGHDSDGNYVGGWELQELRSVQDWLVRYELMAVPGVAEVASIGGFEKEYQVEADPDALLRYDVSLAQLVSAVRKSNEDSGARTIEINKAEYLVRGLGFVRSVSDIEQAVLKVVDNVPVRVKDVARVILGPALRRGALDKNGHEAVGGVVVAQFGTNPQQVIDGVKKRLQKIANSLPVKTVTRYTASGQPVELKSRVTIVPFYDRSGLIAETLGTLQSALTQQIMITIIVIVVMLMHLRSSLLISLTLPLAVLLCFIMMKLFNVTANVVALAGIAIAIGTIVDMGIVLTENILKRIESEDIEESPLESVYHSCREVGSAVAAAVATTIIGFLPVFFLAGDQGKLYRPLAFTKTFALGSSLAVALLVIPPLAYYMLRRHGETLTRPQPPKWRKYMASLLVAALALYFLASDWMPLGQGVGLIINLLFCSFAVGGLLGSFYVFRMLYPRLLRWCLDHKLFFMLLPLSLFFAGFNIWRNLKPELMPRLDEGSFLFMPSTMPHASIGEVQQVLRQQDSAISDLPEVIEAVGKLGRADTSLDPAPVDMIETVINYYPEYYRRKDGRIPTFAFNRNKTGYLLGMNGQALKAPDGEPYTVKGVYERDRFGRLIPDKSGRPFRMWRVKLDPKLNPGRDAWQGIKTPDDIWDEVVRVAAVPGVTSASKLGPIETRIVMLQSGMKGSTGIKIIGRGNITPQQMQDAGRLVEEALQKVPAINTGSISLDRVMGKPYLELDIDRQAIARYGLNISDVQDVIHAAVGGMEATRTVEGRERYGVLVRYMRELRDSPQELLNIRVKTASGATVPLKQLLKNGELSFRSGPKVIKGEDGGLALYITFEAAKKFTAVQAVEKTAELLEHLQAEGKLVLPAGVSYEFVGEFKKYQQTMHYLMVLVPVALLLIFGILYWQFGRMSTSLIVFSGVAVAWMGGFLMIWLYSQDWFMNFSIFDQSVRELFQMREIRLSTAVWVGFLALFGIATDDGVVMATYLEQRFADVSYLDREHVKQLTMAAAQRRIGPCLMTTATTILALLPVLSGNGRGAEIMAPMAVPVFGGMVFEVITMFIVPVLYCWLREREVVE